MKTVPLRKLIERMKHVVLTEVCPKVKSRDVERELIKMCGGR